MVNTALTVNILSLMNGVYGDQIMRLLKSVLATYSAVKILPLAMALAGFVAIASPAPALAQSAVETKEVNEIELERVRSTIQKAKRTTRGSAR